MLHKFNLAIYLWPLKRSEKKGIIILIRYETNEWQEPGVVYGVGGWSGSITVCLLFINNLLYIYIISVELYECHWTLLRWLSIFCETKGSCFVTIRHIFVNHQCIFYFLLSKYIQHTNGNVYKYLQIILLMLLLLVLFVAIRFCIHNKSSTTQFIRIRNRLNSDYDGHQYTINWPNTIVKCVYSKA